MDSIRAANVFEEIARLQEQPDEGGVMAKALAEERAPSESEVDEAVQESMPASDPPAWTSTHAGSPRRDVA